MPQVWHISNTKTQHINTQNMQNILNDKITKLQKLLLPLNCGQKHAEQTRKVALTKDDYSGIDNNLTDQSVLEEALGGFFQAGQAVPDRNSDQEWNSLMESNPAAA